MRNLNQYLVERLKINKNNKPIQYHYHPKDFNDLRALLKQLLDERGKDADLNDIDVSQVNLFYNKDKTLGLFEKLDPHNIDISKWDVSNVEDMLGTFFECKNFNCNLSNWNVSNVKKMVSMFNGCENFNCNLSKWDVRKVNDMYCMFKKCTKFTGQGLENWKLIKCKDMGNMFNGCISLKNKPSWYKQ